MNAISILAVTVPLYFNDGTKKRRYSKPDYCYFCDKRLTSKISKHYLGVHCDEEIVKDIALLQIGSPARKQALHKLQNMGNYKHNCKVSFAILHSVDDCIEH